MANKKLKALPFVEGPPVTPEIIAERVVAKRAELVRELRMHLTAETQNMIELRRTLDAERYDLVNAHGIFQANGPRVDAIMAQIQTLTVVLLMTKSRNW